MNRFVLVMCFVLLSQSAWAQGEYEKGVWLDLNGYKHEQGMYWDVETEQLYLENTEVLTAKDIHSFLLDGQKYEAKVIRLYDGQPERHIVKTLVDGQVSLWMWEGGESVEFFMQVKGAEMKHLPENAVTENGKLRNNYIHLLNETLSKEGELLSETVHLPYEEKALLNFIRDYNYFYFPGKPVTSYEVKQPLQHELWVQAGYGTGTNALHNSSMVGEMTAGVHYSLHFPQQMNRFAVQAGAFFSTADLPEDLHHLEHRVQILRLPLTLYYQFEKHKRFRPYMFAGFMPSVIWHQDYEYYMLVEDANGVLIRDEDQGIQVHRAGERYLKTYTLGGGVKVDMGTFPDLKLEAVATPQTITLSVGINVWKYSR